MADVVVYKLGPGRSAISLVGHDAYFDHQGLYTVFAPAVGRRLVGGGQFGREFVSATSLTGRIPI